MESINYQFIVISNQGPHRPTPTAIASLQFERREISNRWPPPQLGHRRNEDLRGDIGAVFGDVTWLGLRISREIGQSLRRTFGVSTRIRGGTTPRAAESTPESTDLYVS
jgi:hypothetical protein